MLAPIKSEILEIVTARGSHTTAAVRCIKLGSKGVHEELCTDGEISYNQVIERQPSMKEPMDKGLQYTVIR